MQLKRDYCRLIAAAGEIAREMSFRCLNKWVAEINTRGILSMLEQSQPVTALAGNKNARDCKSFYHYETKLLSKIFLTPRVKRGVLFCTAMCVCLCVGV